MATTAAPPSGSADTYRLQSKVQAVDATGQPVMLESTLEYPRDAAEKPAMPADSMQAVHDGARLDFQASYAGISPEQELAVQGAKPTSGGGAGGGGDGGGASGGAGGASSGSREPSDVISARPVESASPSEGEPTAIPTGSLSDLIKDGAEKLGEQIRDQLKDITGFTITITRGTDGSVKIDGDIKRADGAVPTGGTGGDEPPATGGDEPPATGGDEPPTIERHEVETATHASEYRAGATHAIAQPSIIRASLVASNVARPTQQGPDAVSSTVASNASANSRNNALLLNKIACIEGNALSINVCLINLTIG